MNLDKQPHNPYAAPASTAQARQQCYRNGSQLVVPTGAALPHRCVKCNAPATMDKPKTYSWHHPAYYLLILPGLIFYVLAALFVYKKAKIAIGVCAQHRLRRRLFGAAALAMLAAGFVTMVLAIDSDNGMLPVVSALTFLAAVLLAIFGTRMLSVKRLAPEEAFLNGCGEEFLASLPAR